MADQTYAAETLQSFTRGIQPLILNSCGSGACHGDNKESGYDLKRALSASQVTPTLTRHNLGQTLALIDREAPEMSPLLRKALEAHGGSAKPPIAGRDSPAYKNLEGWVMKTSMSAKPKALTRIPNLEPSSSERARDIRYHPRHAGATDASGEFASDAAPAEEKPGPRPETTSPDEAAATPTEEAPKRDQVVPLVPPETPPQPPPAPPSGRSGRFRKQPATPLLANLFNRGVQPPREPKASSPVTKLPPISTAVPAAADPVKARPALPAGEPVTTPSPPQKPTATPAPVDPFDPALFNRQFHPERK